MLAIIPIWLGLDTINNRIKIEYGARLVFQAILFPIWTRKKNNVLKNVPNITDEPMSAVEWYVCVRNVL